jgi:hypothetical protein
MQSSLPPPLRRKISQANETPGLRGVEVVVLVIAARALLEEIWGSGFPKEFGNANKPPKKGNRRPVRGGGIA